MQGFHRLCNHCSWKADSNRIAPGNNRGAVSTGTDQVRSVELAMAKRGNQLLGHPVELQRENSLCSPEGGTIAALKVVARPETVAILGTTCSGSAMPASRIMSEAGMVMVSGTNSAHSLTAINGKQGENWRPGYFRTMVSDAGLGQSAAKFVFKELGITKAATIDDGDPYTRGLAELFRKAFIKSVGTDGVGM
ncbi:MAG: ABC transporter substrate-binding protein, partial [Desulfobacteraceae bacterium]|nr:ABC transporter substrate-binding protein [Desulfobacteraceae bacterium]